MFLIFLSFALLSTYCHLFISTPFTIPPWISVHPPSPSPHPASPRCPLRSISETFHFCLSLFLHSLPYPNPDHVGKYICRQQKADSLPLSFLAPSLFLSLSLSDIPPM